MTRRPVLPGAAELFRRTDTPPEAEVTELPTLSSAAASPALRSRRAAAEPDPDPEQPAPLTLVPGGAPADPLAAFRAPAPPAPGARTRGKAARAAGNGRTRHDEKITVYISADDLLALESARLSLRAEHGLAADRGRIVREAVSVLLADLAENGGDSVLVRRLRG
ncbi:hypothetical protein SAMN05660359_04724 [Geodermatophilus obscurus]|uniref:Cobyrinic acid a,c-diamide synthase n=1 Tax=Geodermatophilus obscurus TaxID=1861 RepID=A0A1I5IMK4_9ACTN|nr:hypothetical protein [Geodermatophilus obscurus]SFO61539.1 hypothetical protein SAMN05660359_04724 [Geodermatophilus obscurus]